jgi:hypothetical protein
LDEGKEIWNSGKKEGKMKTIEWLNENRWQSPSHRGFAIELSRQQASS